MKEVLDNIAKVLSVVLYPLFVPTYGMGLFCWAYSLHVAPLNLAWVLVAIIGTFFLTCLCPVTSIWIMMKRGQVTDMQIEDAQERFMPYLYSFISFCFWCYLLISILHAPLFLSFVAVGATAAIGIVTLTNRHWKISAHLSGFGGLVGGLMAYCLEIGALPTCGTWSLWFGISLLLMYARLRLNAHTPAQVCAGWLLGMTCTFIPYCIYCYAI